MPLHEIQQGARVMLESLPAGALVFGVLSFMAALALIRAVRSALL